MRSSINKIGNMWEVVMNNNFYIVLQSIIDSDEVTHGVIIEISQDFSGTFEIQNG